LRAAATTEIDLGQPEAVEHFGSLRGLGSLRGHRSQIETPPVLSENSPGAIIVRFSSDPIIGRSWSDASESSLGVVS
jgi:hypothetical protein